MNQVRCLLLTSATLLAACGGGSGSDSVETTDDGLGPSGQAPGTVVISSGSAGMAAVNLDDADRALAIWGNGNTVTVGDALVWSRNDSVGSWQSPEVLVTGITPFFVPVLRADVAGNAAMSWGTSDLLRYSPSDEWTALAPDTPALTPLINLIRSRADRDSDLVLLSDGSIAFTGRPDPRNDVNLKLVKQDTSGAWGTLKEFLNDPSIPTAHSPHLTVKPDGHGIYVWLEEELQTDGQFKNRIKFELRHVAQNLATSPFTLAVGPYVPCSPKSAVAAASDAWAVVALMHSRDGDNRKCDLDLVRFDLAGAASAAQTMTAGDFFVERPPILAMSDSGNAVAIWIENQLDAFNNSTPMRLRWSQSIGGGPWSDPKPVVTDADGVGEPYRTLDAFAFALNPAGAGVTGLLTIKDQHSRVVVGRFSFSSGWSDWRIVATKKETLFPNVAINTAGHALLVYGGVPCRRVSKDLFIDCGGPEMYALRF